MRYITLLLVAAACTDASGSQLPPPHCATEIVATYTRLGPPDSVVVESWAIDSAGRRIPVGGPGTHYFEGWWYGSRVESFSWGGERRTCESASTQH